VLLHAGARVAVLGGLPSEAGALAVRVVPEPLAHLLALHAEDAEPGLQQRPVLSVVAVVCRRSGRERGERGRAEARRGLHFT